MSQPIIGIEFKPVDNSNGTWSIEITTTPNNKSATMHGQHETIRDAMKDAQQFLRDLGTNAAVRITISNVVHHDLSKSAWFLINGITPSGIFTSSSLSLSDYNQLLSNNYHELG